MIIVLQCFAVTCTSHRQIEKKGQKDVVLLFFFCLCFFFRSTRLAFLLLLLLQILHLLHLLFIRGPERSGEYGEKEREG